MTSPLIPFISHLRAAVLEERTNCRPLRFVSFEQEAVADSDTAQVFRTVSISTKLEYKERIDERELRQRRATWELPLGDVRNRAVRSIVHEVYGPVTDELFEILAEFWEAGEHKNPAVQKLEALVNQLRAKELS